MIAATAIKRVPSPRRSAGAVNPVLDAARAEVGDLLSVMAHPANSPVSGSAAPGPLRPSSGPRVVDEPREAID